MERLVNGGEFDRSVTLTVHRNDEYIEVSGQAAAVMFFWTAYQTTLWPRWFQESTQRWHATIAKAICRGDGIKLYCDNYFHRSAADDAIRACRAMGIAIMDEWRD